MKMGNSPGSGFSPDPSHQDTPPEQVPAPAAEESCGLKGVRCPEVDLSAFSAQMRAVVNDRIVQRETETRNPDGSKTRYFSAEDNDRKSWGIEIVDPEGNRVSYGEIVEYREKPKPQPAGAGQPPDDPFPTIKVFINGKEDFGKEDLGAILSAMLPDDNYQR